ncbi:hypothetical protein D6D22_03778 [Aureobasidium pullulans]|uniref:Dolichyl-diphosphooligosaccharide--protein glycosyltransferase subunit 4 n=1 Tax=Aureobasidium pullulans TaxID=5580 RepID=A0A4S8Y2W1_AURPU|nr:hypothetical protein D6D22_03778 [Aureobasidium pullulans]
MPRSRTFLLGRPSPCSVTTLYHITALTSCTNLLYKHNLALISLSNFPNNYKLTHTLLTPAIMISDDQLYQLAIFLGSVSMLLIVLYHFLEVNAENDDKATPLSAERKADTVPGAKPVRS